MFFYRLRGNLIFRENLYLNKIFKMRSINLLNKIKAKFYCILLYAAAYKRKHNKDMFKSNSPRP
jgi:hypothetical protein